MGSWIVVGIQITLSALTLAAVALAVVWARAGARDGKEARRLVESLAASLGKGHGGEPGEPAPALARVATARSVPPASPVDATGDRPAIEIAPLASPANDDEEAPPSGSRAQGERLLGEMLWTPAQLARFDAYAKQEGITRKQAILRFMSAGFEVAEARAWLQKVRDVWTPAERATVLMAAHCHRPECSANPACPCPCEGCDVARRLR
jgi:hypothetical protein